MSKKRTHSDAFLRYGFVNIPSGGEDRPPCVIYHKVLTNESLKPSKLSTHLQKCHPNLQNKDQAYFQRQAVAPKNIQFGSSGIQAQKLQAAVEASYFVAYEVAEQQKCHTIAENLIMPCAYEMVSKVSVDGAPAMIGGHRGLRGLIQAVNPEISVDHCIIHRYSLGSKSLPGDLKLVFEDVLKIVNFIKSTDVNSRIFKELCKEMGEKYEVLLYHTDVRWLSRGKIIHRVIELRKAIQEFLEQKGSPFATKFTDKEWLARLCYLADIFAELNSGNLQLQGRNTTVINAHHSVAAFLGKLRLWIRRLEKGVIAQFPTLDQFIKENSHDTGSLLQTINKEMSDHLKGLETSMHHYFPESDQETDSLQWIIHPFSVPDEAIHDDDFPAKEEWITMRANEGLKIELQNQNADSF
ncbi:Ribonuclease H-like domain [Trinorchestia longiramus]|nr:Ribonuclease H-like domain [Trinorchestia longiramus]